MYRVDYVGSDGRRHFKFLPTAEAAEDFRKPARGPGLKEPRRWTERRGSKPKVGQDFGKTSRIALTAGNSLRPAKSGS